MSFRKKVPLLLSALLFSIVVYAEPKAAADTVVVIVEEIGPGQAHPPKAPAIIPVDCVYSASFSALIVNSFFNLGIVFVEIENQTTGEHSQSFINVLTGTTYLPISGSAGNWRIRFTLSDGLVYLGLFSIY
jgi:hypothetical protein